MVSIYYSESDQNDTVTHVVVAIVCGLDDVIHNNYSNYYLLS